jgi:hypothetical protein
MSSAAISTDAALRVSDPGLLYTSCSKQAGKSRELALGSSRKLRETTRGRPERHLRSSAAEWRKQSRWAGLRTDGLPLPPSSPSPPTALAYLGVGRAVVFRSKDSVIEPAHPRTVP